MRFLRATGWIYLGGMIAAAGLAFPPWWLTQTPSQIAVAVGLIIFWPVTVILHLARLF
jgi:hypothetical protein